MRLKYNGDTGENFVNTLKKVAAILQHLGKFEFILLYVSIG